MFKDKLYIINKDLALHHRAKDDALSQAIQSRLNIGLVSYMDSLDKSYTYLKHRTDTRVLSKMNRG